MVAIHEDEIIIPLNEIDPLIRKTITELNKKCYFTMFSCQGHYTRLKPTYITFKGKIQFPYLPEGFEIAAFGSNRRRTTIIDWNMNYEAHNERVVNNLLLEWTHQLPSRCSDDDKIVVKIDLGEGCGGMILLDDI